MYLHTQRPWLRPLACSSLSKFCCVDQLRRSDLQYIGRLERGGWQGGSRIDNIRKLAEALGVEPAELVRNA